MYSCEGIGRQTKRLFRPGPLRKTSDRPSPRQCDYGRFRPVCYTNPKNRKHTPW